MDLCVNAEVECVDGRCGHFMCLVVNPVDQQVTHLVVEEPNFPHTPRLVPIDRIAESDPNRIRLHCSSQELAGMEPFVEYENVQGDIPFYGYTGDAYWLLPYAIPGNLVVTDEHEHIPAGELAVRRKTRVEASDGPIGCIDSFLVDPATGHITHLVVREGHLWGQKDVTIPVAEIDRIEENRVHLKLDKYSVGRMPTIPIHRKLR